MYSESTQNFELFKTIIETENLTQITESEQTQTEFISSLKKKQFTPAQILELIHTAKDIQIKSLFIIYLLSQKSYLSSLTGESVLTRLDSKKEYSPSRLNALIHELDIRTLSESLLAQLQPESALSLLCSVPHFHRFNQAQIEALLLKNALPAVIHYWLNHFAGLPNAHFTLTHLIKLAEAEVFAVFKNLEESKRIPLFIKVLHHLELFDPLDVLHLEQPSEPHLILAIRLYLNGHTHPAYVSYIKSLIDSLLNQEHAFSEESIQLFISLHRIPDFEQLNNKLDFVTRHYLRDNAQQNNTKVFYDANRPNLFRMTYPFQLKPSPSAPPTTLNGLLSSFLGSPKTTYPEIQSEPNEHPMIKGLIERNITIQSFDYFLIHYKGSGAKIGKVIADYLRYYSKTKDEFNPKNMYLTNIIMLKKEIDPLVREAIFTSFLRRPELFDAQISAYMLQYDAQRVFKYFGMRGGKEHYQTLISICTGALTRLDPKSQQNIINMAHRARAEALVEVNFLEDGFFARLFRRFVRCWRNGWSGFFSPKLPAYVVPEESIQPQSPLDEEQGSEGNDLPPVKTLLSLLDENIQQIPQSLDVIIDALNDYSLQALPENEFEVRNNTHLLFCDLLEKAKKNQGINNWLLRQGDALTKNSLRLLELLLEKGEQERVEALLNELNYPPFQNISRELLCELPEQSTGAIVSEEPQAPPDSNSITTEFMEAATEIVEVATGFLGNATGYLGTAGGYASNLASSLTGFFSYPAPEEQPPADDSTPRLADAPM